LLLKQLRDARKTATSRGKRPPPPAPSAETLNAEQVSALAIVSAEIAALSTKPKPPTSKELAELSTRLREAYQTDLEIVERSRARISAKCDWQIKISGQHMRLKRQFGKLQRRAASPARPRRPSA
jgi:hypothetical protein